jgi:phosphoribosylglycinamide formyltransferase-1
MPEPLALGVLLSGSGTNLQALIDAIAAGRLHARIAVVVSNIPEALGVERPAATGSDRRGRPPRCAVARSLRRAWSRSCARTR